ncbi:MAG: M23 family metallopeptidase [Pyrinomonadaceae bacterium]
MVTAIIWGEDWNRGPIALADDYGDAVYTVANGEVIFAQSNVPIPGRPYPWGKVIIVRHILPDGTQVESQYAHLKDMYVTAGTVVTRGQAIGTIGDAEGTYVPHLHFEIRYSNSRAWGTPRPGLEH